VQTFKHLSSTSCWIVNCVSDNGQYIFMISQYL